MEGFHKNLLRLVQGRQHSHFQESALAARKQSTNALNFRIQLRGWQSNCKRFVSSSAFDLLSGFTFKQSIQEISVFRGINGFQPRILAKFSRFISIQSELKIFRWKLNINRICLFFNRERALRATPLFFRRAGKFVGGHEKGPATGAIGLRELRRSVRFLRWALPSKGETSGAMPRYPGTGEGRTYANYVCVLRSHESLSSCSEHLKSFLEP